LPRKFRRDNFLSRKTTRVELRDSPQLVGLQARSVSQYVLNNSFLPASLLDETAARCRQLRTVLYLCLGSSRSYRGSVASSGFPTPGNDS
jgi:hypothetical protein